MTYAARNLDVALLWTLVGVSGLGGFVRAATRIARSESAVSLQLKKLEEQIGRPLLHRAGRGVALTDAGEVLLTYARRLIELNDETLAAAAGASIEGSVRLGVPQDFADIWLPATLVRFIRTHPGIRVETVIDRSPALARKLEHGELDLAMTIAPVRPRTALWSAALPMRWIGPRGFVAADAMDPLSLAVFDPPCFFRSAATAALDKAGIAWKVAFTSPNLASLWAAVSGGLGVTVRAPVGLPSQLLALGDEAGLPALPSVALVMTGRDDRQRSAAAARLSDVLVETLEATLDAAF
jgi:DNA-binding transcriptional LysR family regulator